MKKPLEARRNTDCRFYAECLARAAREEAPGLPNPAGETENESPGTRLPGQKEKRDQSPMSVL